MVVGKDGVGQLGDGVEVFVVEKPAFTGLRVANEETFFGVIQKFVISLFGRSENKGACSKREYKVGCRWLVEKDLNGCLGGNSGVRDAIMEVCC